MEEREKRETKHIVVVPSQLSRIALPAGRPPLSAARSCPSPFTACLLW